MPPALDHPPLNLILLDKPFIVYKLSVEESLPPNIVEAISHNVADEEMISITRTSDEISIVGNIDSLPDIEAPRWKCIKIKGNLDFGLTGIMCDFTTPLKRAEISIFALSTWQVHKNTDYILVPEAKLDDAVKVLKEDGWKFE
ncbi:uncharacterized protein FOMMEDRAFT_61694, partial [Fomitiporia mediterranea MF3/22]|uniref:uncharacterized protein n=1 Tax=Fomitiporia mediterranea (strain MF3/22) TaxID=694068 RepID=UPI0004408AA1